MSGGIYDGHRGGYSSNFDTYSTWKNNTKGLYNEYRIDGSWMDDGDYDKAFKGYPSNKTVNIFMGGVYQEPSWKTTLISGGIGLGITALGMWAMGLFGGKKAKPEQPSTALNLGVSSGYWDSYFSNWKLPSLFGNGGASTDVTTPDTSKKNVDTTDNNKKAATPDTKKAAAATSTPATPDTANTNKTEGRAFNTTLIKNFAIEGDVTEIGKNNDKGYPESFKITDTTYSQDKPNIYLYKFVRMNGDKPQYQIDGITYYSEKDKTNDITKNTYTITNNAVKKGQKGEAGKVDSKIEMSTTSDKPAMHNPGETGKGTEQHYPPKK